MTELIQNLEFIISIATCIGFIILAYKTFRDPDIKSDKSIELLKAELKSARELSFQTVKTMQNDLHTLNNQVSDNSKEIVELCKCFVRLKTIIEERIPKKI